MARKRGGLAGIWDRNKNVITPVAAGIAGVLGTPALGAAVGAAMRGLDRKGKSGIGFDVGQGLRGGVEGYAMGKLGGIAKGGFGLGGAASGALPSASVAGAPVTQFPSAIGTLAKSAAQTGGSWLKDPKNLQTAIAGVSTVGGLVDARGQQRLANRSQDLEAQGLALRERQQQQEEDLLNRRRKTAEALLPFLMQGMGGGR
jgi:hypothetical protein